MAVTAMRRELWWRQRRCAIACSLVNGRSILESLQSPVIVLSDMALGQTLTVVDPKPERPQPLKRRTDLPEGPFKRYAIGRSRRCLGPERLMVSGSAKP
jgi:hypothetical protein